MRPNIGDPILDRDRKIGSIGRVIEQSIVPGLEGESIFLVAVNMDDKNCNCSNIQIVWRPEGWKRI